MKKLRLLSKIQNQIATKVAITVLIVVFIATFFTSIFFYHAASNVVKKNVRESSLQIAKQAADSLSFIFSIGSDMSDLVYSNETLQSIVIQDKNPELTVNGKSKNNEEMHSFLNSQIYSSTFVRIIYILKEEGTSWGSGTFSQYKLSQYELKDLDWIQDATANDGEVVWHSLQYDRFSGAGKNTELILPISRVMKDFYNMDNIAYIQVALDGSAILDKINQLSLGKTGRFFVVNNAGVVMIDSDLQNVNKRIEEESEELYSHLFERETSEFEFDYQGTDYYGVKHPISNGWTIVGVVPTNEITGELSQIRHLTIVTSVLFGIVAMIFGIVVARRVMYPIHVLTRQMRLVGEGNFTVRTKVQTNDEIGLLSHQFNRMISQVEQLLEMVKEEKSEKQKAELRAIRHRINPHFLFNTLSTIRWLVKFNESVKANTALSALIRLLEANMGKKGTFVTIKEEIDIVEKFIAILQIRYEQTFHLELSVDPTLEEFHIPQMLLQPIVENAIFHGIVPTGGEGTITLSVQKGVDEIEIIVHNNGIGMKKEIIEQLLNSPTTRDVGGIGMLHVLDSVRLYYGSGSEVNIESDENGTSVKLLLLPKIGDGNHVERYDS
jgi:two-component system sensor histidine kinase YesM